MAHEQKRNMIQDRKEYSKNEFEQNLRKQDPDCN